jgi:signal peptidase I
MKTSGFLADFREMIILLAIVLLIRTFGFGLYHVPTPSMETTMLVGERFFGDKLTVFFTDIKRGDIVAFNAPGFKYSSNSIVRLIQEYFWGPDNWTKRVIGIPGDEVKGVIEDGKPVIYLNGKKLDEPYLNKYPLIYTWKLDLSDLKALAEKNPGINLGQFLSAKSFDPNIPLFDAKQPFYKIKEDRIFIDQQTEKPTIIEPGTLTKERGQKIVRGDNYWNNGDDFYVKLGADEYWFMGDNRLGSSDARVFGPQKGKYIRARILFRIWSVDTDETWWIWDLIKNPVDFFRRVRWNRLFQGVK